MSETTVLLVEDDEDVVETYEIWLRGYDTRTAGGGEEALEKLDGEVDVVVLDRMMPGLSGDETLAEIREGPHDPRVAMVTAVGADTDILELPIDAFLPKPVSKDGLEAAVEALSAREELSPDARRLCSVAERLAAVGDALTGEELEASGAYADLRAECSELVDAVDADLAGYLVAADPAAIA
jgi:DNA-binding response OmpR family regulator